MKRGVHLFGVVSLWLTTGCSDQPISLGGGGAGGSSADGGVGVGASHAGGDGGAATSSGGGGAGGASAGGASAGGAGGSGVGGALAGGGGAGGGADIHVCPSTDPLECSPGPGTGEGDQCADAPSCYLAAVKSAVNGVLNDYPSWFDYNNPNNCPYILELDLFLDSVVARLESQELCAIRDPNAPGEEITVKHDNAYSENFDIVASTGCARYGDGIYTGYCAPAWW
ncbi:MAG: hypothetical protein U0271_36480 [Polyangiaceae bacterium]